MASRMDGMGVAVAIMVAIASATVAAVMIGEQGEASPGLAADAYHKYTVTFTVSDVSSYAYYTADFGDGEVFDTRTGLSPDVTVEANGDGTKDISFVHTYPEIPDRRYTFVFTAGNSGGAQVAKSMDILLKGYPVVTFDTGGGSPVDPQTVRNGSGNGGTPATEYYTPATRPADPVMGGRAFAGWFSDPGLTSEFDWDTPVTEDVTLYAAWEDRAFGVVFVVDGAIYSEAVCRGEGDYPADPSKEGCEFTGWFADPGCTRPFDIGSLTGDAAAYAGFRQTGPEEGPSLSVAALAIAAAALAVLGVAAVGGRRSGARRRGSRRSSRGRGRRA